MYAFAALDHLRGSIMIRYHCEHCGSAIDVLDSLRGQFTKCPLCSARTRVPGGPGAPRHAVGGAWVLLLFFAWAGGGLYLALAILGLGWFWSAVSSFFLGLGASDILLHQVKARKCIGSARRALNEEAAAPVLVACLFDFFGPKRTGQEVGGGSICCGFFATAILVVGLIWRLDIATGWRLLLVLPALVLLAICVSKGASALFDSRRLWRRVQGLIEARGNERWAQFRKAWAQEVQHRSPVQTFEGEDRKVPPRRVSPSAAPGVPAKPATTGRCPFRNDAGLCVPPGHGARPPCSFTGSDFRNACNVYPVHAHDAALLDAKRAAARQLGESEFARRLAEIRERYGSDIDAARVLVAEQQAESLPKRDYRGTPECPLVQAKLARMRDLTLAFSFARVSVTREYHAICHACEHFKGLVCMG